MVYMVYNTISYKFIIYSIYIIYNIYNFINADKMTQRYYFILTEL